MAKKKDKLYLVLGWILIVIGIISLIGFRNVILLLLTVFGAYLLYKYYEGK